MSDQQQFVMFTVDRIIFAHGRPRLYFFLPADDPVEIEDSGHSELKFLGVKLEFALEAVTIEAKDIPLGTVLPSSKAVIVQKKIIKDMSETGLSHQEWYGLVDDKFLEGASPLTQ